MNYSLSPEEGYHLSQQLGNRWLKLAPGYQTRQRVQLSLDNLADAKEVYTRTKDLRLKDRIARSIPKAADPDHASQYKPLRLTDEQKQAVKKAYPSMLPYNVIGKDWRVDKYEAQVLTSALTHGTWFDRPSGASEIADAITKTFNT